MYKNFNLRQYIKKLIFDIQGNITFIILKKKNAPNRLQIAVNYCKKIKKKFS